MTMITMQDGTRIFYKDWGPKEAQPIMFHHGWPLSADDWDNQMLFSLDKGYRVVAHDRRGHGRSETYLGLSHGMFATHPELINADLLAFIEDRAGHEGSD